MEDETVSMKLEGKMVNILTNLEPKLYRKYIRTEGNKPIMYVELKKALYGTLQAALLFWKNLITSLHEWGFEINPYVWCVANKTVNDKQLKILRIFNNLQKTRNPKNEKHIFLIFLLLCLIRAPTVIPVISDIFDTSLNNHSSHF